MLLTVTLRNRGQHGALESADSLFYVETASQNHVDRRGFAIMRRVAGDVEIRDV